MNVVARKKLIRGSVFGVVAVLGVGIFLSTGPCADLFIISAGLVGIISGAIAAGYIVAFAFLIGAPDDQSSG